jgi:(2Fe-2S) ferredoxin
LVSEQPCTAADIESLADNCSAHSHYPKAILSKINWTDSPVGSVKAHAKHVLMAQGSDSQRWAEEVTDVKGSYAAALDAALTAAKGDLPIKVRASLSDAQSLDEHDRPLGDLSGEEQAPDATCDLLVFPDAIRVRAVRKDRLDEFVAALAQLANAQIKAAAAATTAAASSASADASAAAAAATAAAAGDGAAASSAPSVAAPVFSLPHEPLTGTWFLVCCHKLRDKRCGVAGPILVDEFEKHLSLSYPSSPPPTPVHTVKVSHLGGHKFAGILVVYPSGLWYARVLPCHVPHLLLAHVPEGFEVLDQSTGERVNAAKAGGVEAQRSKLAPLVRGQVDAIGGGGGVAKDGKCAVA